ncbi:hypothetical protein AALP_AA3G318200 [Arabis alpina]|uniref:Uncharacterized protein n=1 Tax=Arabis alpina TaxID=50452 RepID=A0A087HD07_ARAAL|nr:hypothetical protein AALP_AA3G318200 [Arabis alpina]
MRMINSRRIEIWKFKLRLYPRGSPSRNSLKPETSPDKRGGLEIVFNQQ